LLLFFEGWAHALSQFVQLVIGTDWRGLGYGKLREEKEEETRRWHAPMACLNKADGFEYRQGSLRSPGRPVQTPKYRQAPGRARRHDDILFAVSVLPETIRIYHTMLSRNGQAVQKIHCFTFLEKVNIFV
jgi:hypothetical protein